MAGQVARVGDGEVFTRAANDDPGAIVAHNLQTGSTRELYRPDQGRVFDFAVSPSGKFTAVLQQIRLGEDDSVGVVKLSDFGPFR